VRIHEYNMHVGNFLTQSIIYGISKTNDYGIENEKRYSGEFQVIFFRQHLNS